MIFDILHVSKLRGS